MPGPYRGAGRFTARIVGGGVPDAPQGSSLSRVTCRAASPLAAVAVCGDGKVPGRDEPLPYGLNHKRDLAISCGPGIPGPYRAAMGKQDVAASWRAAYMRPLQSDKKFIAAGVRGNTRI